MQVINCGLDLLLLATLIREHGKSLLFYTSLSLFPCAFFYLYDLLDYEFLYGYLIHQILGFSNLFCHLLSFRLFAVVDDIFCLFEGHIENVAHLKQQYGLTKTANEVIIVIEAYRTLRDRGPYPADQVVKDIQGKFAFILFDGTSQSTFIASVSNSLILLMLAIYFRLAHYSVYLVRALLLAG